MASGVRSLNWMASTIPPCKASSAEFGVILRAESDGGVETGRRARRRRAFQGVPELSLIHI
eukprot:7484157-Alexandrium_andersonii.AAC.1